MPKAAIKKKETKQYPKDNAVVNLVLEDLVKYISKNGVQRSIKPIFKTDDFALYNDDSLEVMNRFPDNYVDMIGVSFDYKGQAFRSNLLFVPHKRISTSILNAIAA